MLSTTPKTVNASNRVAILQAIKNPLHFFVLVVLVSEGVLGGIAASIGGPNQPTFYGMLLLLAALIGVVAFLAYYKPDALRGESAAGSRAQDFCSRITGYWWSTLTSAETISVLGIVEISPDPDVGTVRIKGSGYSRDATLGAKWESTASCTDANNKKVFYQWRGWHPSSPNDQYEGFGQISFFDSLDSGDGIYHELSLEKNLQSVTRKTSQFVRCTKQEVQIIGRQSDGKRMSDLIRRKFDQLG